MEDISRKELDKICDILNKDVNTKESITLATKLYNADVIPKLYAHTYFKKIYAEMELLRVNCPSFDFEGLCITNENIPALQLDVIKSKKEANTVLEILHNGFKRENQFCDFDDSRYHDKVKVTGKCDCEDHEDNTEPKMNSYLIPIYFTNHETNKYEDKPEFWCEDCADSCEGDSEIDVSCDMEMNG